MATAAEYWYVRLPDGRTMRARNADILRSYLRAGRIPADSRVRRSGDNAWHALGAVDEFADALGAEPAGDVDGAVGGGEMRAVGIRGLADELFNALDSSLERAKLAIAAGAGLALALGVIGIDLALALPPGWSSIGAFAGVAVFLLAAVSLATTLLTQITVIEVDRHRPAQGAEIWAGFARQWLRVLIAQGVVAGLVVAVMWFLRAAAPWIVTHDLGDLNPTRDVLLSVLAALRLVFEVICWPILGLAVLLLVPVLVIEEYSILRSLREWLGMVRRHLGRIYLYEALAFMLATTLALPLLLLVGGAAYATGEFFGQVERYTVLVLAGLALTPFIAYLIVANVFIYLNLRYEFFSARDR
jgi:hypothetical protein